MSLTERLLSLLPGEPLTGLRRVDALWKSYREGTVPIVEVVQQSDNPLPSVEWDGIVCGGTLGILVGAALAQRGWKIALLERGVLRGRDQEWNISRRELHTLTALGLLTEAELEQAIATEYNPARIAFHAGVELWVEDVLNVGVDPVYLLETLKQKFLAAGGKLIEQVAFEGATIYPNGVEVRTSSHSFTARLLLDAMGHFSPIARQIRGGASPDAVCLVVGTCAQGYPDNTTGDVFASLTPMENHCQYFWEAFPARDGRTTYLFTYLDAHPDRPSLEAVFDDYFRLLPQYQAVSLEQLQLKRALFGFFPCYRQSPLRSPWKRLLPIGDSSGAQSPLSFGGFGAMIRHLARLVNGIDGALSYDLLGQADLAMLQPYQPNLSITWLFQQSMSARVGQPVEPNQVNRLLSAVFQEMTQLGDPVLKPFLQDVVQFSPLTQTLLRTSLSHPGLVLQLLPQIGLPALVGWMGHYASLGLYSGLYPVVRSLALHLKPPSPQQQYALQRWLDTLKYGSGADYEG